MPVSPLESVCLIQECVCIALLATAAIHEADGSVALCCVGRVSFGRPGESGRCGIHGAMVVHSFVYPG